MDPVYRGLGVSGGMRRIFMDGKTHRVWSAKGIEGYAKASGWRGKRIPLTLPAALFIPLMTWVIQHL